MKVKSRSFRYHLLKRMKLNSVQLAVERQGLGTTAVYSYYSGCPFLSSLYIYAKMILDYLIYLAQACFSSFSLVLSFKSKTNSGVNLNYFIMMRSLEEVSQCSQSCILLYHSSGLSTQLILLLVYYILTSSTSWVIICFYGAEVNTHIFSTHMSFSDPISFLDHVLIRQEQEKENEAVKNLHGE